MPSFPVFAGLPNGLNDGWHLTDTDSLCGIGIAQVDKIQGGGRGIFPTPRTPSGNPVVVAVIDGGFDFSHPDLRDRVWTSPGEIPANGRYRRVDPSAAQYVAGDPGECTITIVGSDYFKIEGTWYVYQQPTDKEAMKGYWYFSDDAFTGFPAATEADTFTFDTEKNVLTSSLQSDLKNFFGETCNRVPADKECSDRDISDRTIEYQLLLIDPDNCNRDFSATSTGADKSAYIGIRVVQAQDPSEDTLELYLLDDQSTSFLTFLTAYYRYNDTRPWPLRPAFTGSSIRRNRSSRKTGTKSDEGR